MRKPGGRIYGPYREQRGWRIVVVDNEGKRASEIYSEEAWAIERVTQLRAKVEEEVWIDEALDQFRRHLEATGVKAVTVETSMHRLRALVKPHADTVRRLTPRRGQALYDRMRERLRPNGKPYSVDYHRNSLSVAKRFGRWCVKERLLKRDPFADVEGVGRRSRGKPKLTIDEARKLYAHCLADQSPEATAVLCGLLLGMRATEVVMLERRAIDDGGRLLRIERTSTKTDAGERILELTPELSARLQALAEVGRLFPGATRYWLHYHCQRLCRMAGVPEVSPHGLRGTQATLATQAGAAATLVQAQLGHTSPEVGRRHYIDEGTREAAQGRAVLSVLEGGKR